MKDLFEYYQEQPQELKNVLNQWQDRINNGLDYNQCAQLLREVEAVGFTFEYELSAEPFNLRKIEPTNLNMLFIDQLPNFAHLVTRTEQTKQQFLNSIKKTYCLSNVKNKLFYQSCEKSIFKTIKLNQTLDSILFNQNQ